MTGVIDLVCISWFVCVHVIVCFLVCVCVCVRARANIYDQLLDQTALAKVRAEAEAAVAREEQALIAGATLQEELEQGRRRWAATADALHALQASAEH